MLAARLATEITHNHMLLRVGCRFLLRQKIERNIIHSFQTAASCGILEQVKNLTDVESSDFCDLTDIISDFSLNNAMRLLALFREFQTPFAHPIKVISDLDNTVIETEACAPAVYVPNDFVFGAIPLIKGLSQSVTTNDEKTTVTFVSARPEHFEVSSICSVKRFLRKDPYAPAFSFASGNFEGPIKYGKGVAMQKIGLKERGRSQILRGCAAFANAKFEKYLALEKVYPHSRFVFLGDDTQGDYLFAQALVSHKPTNFAFIRSAATRENSVVGEWNPRIHFVQSWCQAIASAPEDVLPSANRRIAMREVINSYPHDFVAKRHLFKNPQRAEEDVEYVNAFTRRLLGHL
jgi:hypothetical protein